MGLGRLWAVALLVCFGASCLVVPRTRTTERVVDTRREDYVVGGSGLAIAAAWSDDRLEITTGEARRCRVIEFQTIERTHEREAELSLFDDDDEVHGLEALVAAAILAPVTVPVSGAVTGLIVWLDDPYTDRVVEQELISERPCPDARGNVAVVIRYPSGAVVHAVTDEDGELRVRIPDSEPTSGVAKVFFSSSVRGAKAIRYSLSERALARRTVRMGVEQSRSGLRACAEQAAAAPTLELTFVIERARASFVPPAGMDPAFAACIDGMLQAVEFQGIERRLRVRFPIDLGREPQVPSSPTPARGEGAVTAVAAAVPVVEAVPGAEMASPEESGQQPVQAAVEQTPPEEAPAPISADGRFRVGLRLGVSRPVGEYEEVGATGVQVGADFMVRVFVPWLMAGISVEGFGAPDHESPSSRAYDCGLATTCARTGYGNAVGFIGPVVQLSVPAEVVRPYVSAAYGVRQMSTQFTIEACGPLDADSECEVTNEDIFRATTLGYRLAAGLHLRVLGTKRTAAGESPAFMFLDAQIGYLGGGRTTYVVPGSVELSGDEATYETARGKANAMYLTLGLSFPLGGA